MQFKISSELTYEVSTDTTFLFNIQATNSSTQYIIEESVTVTPTQQFEEFSMPGAEARFIRMSVKAGIVFTIRYRALVEVSYKVIDEALLVNLSSVMELDANVMPYLFPSRHCQSDKLRKLAIKEFGHLENDFIKVNTINEWIYNNTDYISGATDSGTSAYDTLIQREGVCKDFAHLGIGLCRALDIPARYFTGYAANLQPPDFHACFEAYLGGQWIFFDPTKLVPINGLVKIAHCRDAAEAAVASFFGNTMCTFMNVQCTVADPLFKPIIPVSGDWTALSYQ